MRHPCFISQKINCALQGLQGPLVCFLVVFIRELGLSLALIAELEVDVPVHVRSPGGQEGVQNGIQIDVSPA